MKGNVVAIAIALLVTLSGQVLAIGNNPADITATLRVASVPFKKAIYDGGPWSVLASQPLGNRASAMLWSWHAEDNSKEFLESEIAFKATDHLQIGALYDNWRGGEDKASAMLDLSNKQAGFALIAPSIGPTQIAFRAKSGNFWAYATTAQKTRPLLGIGHYDKAVNLDFAFGQDRWYFRASKRYGDIIPELRLRKQDGEFYTGIAVGKCN